MIPAYTTVTAAMATPIIMLRRFMPLKPRPRISSTKKYTASAKIAIHKSSVGLLSAPVMAPNSTPNPKPPTKVPTKRNTPAAMPSRQRLSARSLGRR